MDLVGLFSAYDFEVQFERPEEHKIRFRGKGTFIDLWNGKRGITLGVYNPKSSSLQFHRGMDLNRIEDILIKL